EPVDAVLWIRALRFPRQALGIRLARMLADELFVRLLLMRPPARVVARVRLRMKDERYPCTLHQRDRRGHEIRRIQRIASRVDDEEGTVDEIADEQIAVGAGRGVGEDADAADERQTGRPRRRLAHREVVDAGPAVRDAGNVNPR